MPASALRRVRGRSSVRRALLEVDLRACTVLAPGDTPDVGGDARAELVRGEVNPARSMLQFLMEAEHHPAVAGTGLNPNVICICARTSSPSCSLCGISVVIALGGIVSGQGATRAHAACLMLYIFVFLDFSALKTLMTKQRERDRGQNEGCATSAGTSGCRPRAYRYAPNRAWMVFYAGRRALCTRPARGAYILRSGVSDCCGQGSHVRAVVADDLPGVPRRSIRAVRSRATGHPELEVSEMAAPAGTADETSSFIAARRGICPVSYSFSFVFPSSYA